MRSAFVVADVIYVDVHHVLSFLPHFLFRGWFGDRFCQTCRLLAVAFFSRFAFLCFLRFLHLFFGGLHAHATTCSASTWLSCRSCADPSCLALHRAPLLFSDLGSCLSSAIFTILSFFVSCRHFVTFRDSSHRRFRFLFCSIGRPGVPVVHVDLVVNVGKPSVCKAHKVRFG